MDINSQEHIKTIAPDVAKAYQLGKEQKYDEAYQTLLPLFEAKEIPSYFEEPCGWTIYRYLKNNESKLSSREIRKALSYYLTFASCKPSNLHSCIMIQAANLEKKHENDFRFIEFCLMWKLESLRDEDFVSEKVTTENGRSIEFHSLAENVATRLYKELKKRHTEEFVNELFPFFETVKEKCPNNRFIGMYIAQLYYWQGDTDRAIAEYKHILRTAPEWFIWKHLGDICEDKEVRISLYCKAMTVMGKEEYIGELRLGLANLLLDTNKEQAAYEIEQYMKTYKENGWKISGDVYLLQNKVQGIVPSTQAKQFYLNNIEKAEDFAYSDISVEELTYNGIVTNHAGKEKASLVNKRKKIFVRTSLTPQLRKAEIGDVFLVRVYEHQKRTIALTIHPTDKKNVQSTNTHSAKQGDEADVTVSGIVSFPAQGEFCFIDHKYFVSEKLTKANNLTAGDSVKAKAKKMPDGRWRVVSIIKE
jgi:tetratricopeptide (TPR) repeat protein